MNDRRDEDDEIGVFGGPTSASGLLGVTGHNSGLFDVPDRTPGDMPGLFDRAPRTGDDVAVPSDQPARSGLFDKPAPRPK